MTRPREPGVMGALKRMEALKAVWRKHDRLSQASGLAGKVQALDAARAGAWPVAAIYVQQGYTLPDGLTWPDVADRHASDNRRAHMVPVATAPGCTGWGTPILGGKFLLHPGNL